MATSKISELTAASALAGTNIFPVVQSSTTKKATLAQVATVVRSLGYLKVADIRDYGGNPSSLSDQTAAIQATRDAAAAAGIPAYFPAGLYKYSGAITGNCSIIGDGRNATTFYNTAVDGVGSVWDIDSIDGLVLSGFKMESQYNGGNNLADETSAGIIMEGCTNFEVTDVYFKGIYGAAILIRACSDGEVHGNHFESCWHDTIHLTGGVASGHNNILVYGNNIIDGGDDGIAVVGYSTDTYAIAGINIFGNNINGTKWARGISAIGAKQVQIHSNLIYRSKYAGIIAASESSYGTRVVDQIDIHGNTVIECGDSSVGHGAIFVSADAIAVSNISITKNKILRSAAIGIKAAGDASSIITGLQVFGNVINDTTDPSGKVISAGTGTHSGMEFVEYCKDVSVGNNDVRTTGGYGIYFGASMTGRVIIKDNELANFNQNGAGSIDGIHVTASSTASRIEIDGNSLGDQADTFDQFIECNNPGKTAWGTNPVTSLALGYSYNSGHSWISVTPSGSPYTYTNSNTFPVTVASSGGTVSNIETSPDGTNFYSSGKTSGTFVLYPGAKIRVTYTVAPAMGALPMPNL